MLQSYSRCKFVAALVMLTAGVQQSFAETSLVTALAEIGVTPEALAVNSLEEQAQVIVNNVATAISAYEALSALRQQHAETSENVIGLAQQLQTDPHNESILSQYQSALGQKQNLSQQIAQIQQSLFDQATSSLNSDQKQKLLIWKQSAGRQVPPEFRVVQRSEEQWSAIERALIAERRAQRLDHELDTAHATVLAQVRSEFAIIEAGFSLQQNLATVQGVFQQAVNEP